MRWTLSWSRLIKYRRSIFTCYVCSAPFHIALETATTVKQKNMCIRIHPEKQNWREIHIMECIAGSCLTWLWGLARQVWNPWGKPGLPGSVVCIHIYGHSRAPHSIWAERMFQLFPWVPLIPPSIGEGVGVPSLTLQWGGGRPEISFRSCLTPPQQGEEGQHLTAGWGRRLGYPC